jgi:hypothetical protein
MTSTLSIGLAALRLRELSVFRECVEGTCVVSWQVAGPTIHLAVLSA